MQRGVLIAIGAGIGVALILILSRESEAPGMPEADLSRLVSRARVVWEDYGEDIKAGVGATPAAQWHGAPVEVRLADEAIEVTFELQGLWASYPFGIPILLRTPEGHVISSGSYTRTERGGVYTFRHPDPLSAVSTPWVELRFPPNEEKRITFDSKGVWHAGGAH